jgi:pre-mRNA-splicing factor SPF27
MYVVQYAPTSPIAFISSCLALSSWSTSLSIHYPTLRALLTNLKDIDNEPTAAQRAAAEALITASLSTILDASTHDLLPSLPASSLTPLLESEFARHASKTRITGIDLTRYEALDPPSTSPDSDEKSPETLDLWRATLASAYTSREYLAGRTKKLEELNGNGKEEWLAGNEELVAVLKGLEEELAQKKEEIDLVVVARRNAQEAVAGELTLLEDGWKKGVGRVLETEVAAEGVRGQILDARRGGAL